MSNQAQRRRATRLSRRIPIDPRGLIQLVITGPEPTPWVRDDRDWFAAHPRRSHRARLPFAGETFDARDGATSPQLVVIRQIKPGQRARRPFTIGFCADDTRDLLAGLLRRAFGDDGEDAEGAAHALFDMPGGRVISPAEVAALIATYATTTETN